MNIENPQELVSYLRETKKIQVNENPELRVLAGGVSNRTVLVKRQSGERWVLKQALEQLRVPVPWFSSPERIHREALGLKWLSQIVPEGSVTPFIFEDRQHNVLAMEAVPEPHQNFKSMLLEGQIEQDHVDQFGRLLGVIHRNSYKKGETVPPILLDRSFFESLRLEPYYRFTASQITKAAPFLNDLIQETLGLSLSIVHGDFSPKNILVFQNRLVLIDHEVIHFGDPAFDIGFAMTHFLTKAHHCKVHRDALRLAAKRYWEVYVNTSGLAQGDFEARSVEHTLGCLLARVAGRSQLEYLGENERSCQRDVVVELMQDRPVKIIELIDQFVDRIERYGSN